MPPIIFLAAIMCSTAVIIAAMAIISRHVSQRRLLSPQRDEEITRRLEHIEQIVETTAIEVERLGESNRFVTKLLTEKAEANRSASTASG
jgi:hypothetical protein